MCFEGLAGRCCLVLYGCLYQVAVGVGCDWFFEGGYLACTQISCTGVSWLKHSTTQPPDGRYSGVNNQPFSCWAVPRHGCNSVCGKVAGCWNFGCNSLGCSRRWCQEVVSGILLNKRHTTYTDDKNMPVCPFPCSFPCCIPLMLSSIGRASVACLVCQTLVSA